MQVCKMLQYLEADSKKIIRKNRKNVLKFICTNNPTSARLQLAAARQWPIQTVWTLSFLVTNQFSLPAAGIHPIRGAVLEPPDKPSSQQSGGSCWRTCVRNSRRWISRDWEVFSQPSIFLPDTDADKQHHRRVINVAAFRDRILLIIKCYCTFRIFFFFFFNKPQTTELLYSFMDEQWRK